jgi:hypothetical protein
MRKDESAVNSASRSDDPKRVVEHSYDKVLIHESRIESKVELGEEIPYLRVLGCKKER